MNYPLRPTLKSTDDEFLLFIHPAIKQRAKVIAGYRWDKNRKCWVYPKNLQVYSLLLSEFGEDLKDEAHVKSLTSSEFTQVLDSLRSEYGDEKSLILSEEQSQTEEHDDIQEQYEILQTEHEQLQGEFQKIIEQVNQYEYIEERLPDMSSKLDIVLERFQELLKEKASTEKELEEAKKRINDLNKLLDAKTDIKNDKSSAKNTKSKARLDNLLVDVALEATNDNHKFKALMNRIQYNETLPMIIHIELECEFRRILGIPNEERRDLFSLIQDITDKELLSKDAIDLSHIIRKQRNIMAHKIVYEKTISARLILCLFAAALLWPELPE